MKIHHIGYAVKKIEDSINEFKKLGYGTIGNKITDNLRNVIIQFIKNGDYLIELVAPLNKESPVTNLLKKQGNSPYHVCYITNNLEKKISDLGNSGFVVISDLLKAPAINNKKVIFLYKKEIGLLELVEE